MFRKNKNIKNISGKPSENPRKNRNGIAVFDGNTDLYKIFSDMEDELDPKISPDHGYSYESDVHPNIADSASSGSSGATSSISVIKDVKHVIKDAKHSRPNSKVSPDHEIHGEDFHGKRSGNSVFRNRSSELPSASRLAMRKDKHGIPFLDGSESLSRLFREKSYETGEEEVFPKLLEDSLKGKNRDAIMREKSDRGVPEPLPLKKRLKRYPPAQNVLDLHGMTSAAARQRVEQWLRRLWRNGFFTLQIIVGRGIHSEFGAVLPDVVEDILIRLKKEGVVLWFEWDRKRKSQSGALIVYLNQFD
ncbi:conserved hypothetical protein [Desulfamplus magnetovallimortis]|uniref:Smr domain-containing protein n=1 Tax=Desulfamplus magnetovallimortis TaxID=1246637 RepID=A0A1W1H608_9BACT|nr:Smr/MutS family protein [Desulfamplus magnetovallimortis]SLM27920.1 conserved hypothetical protein [Desulfamplus magnetovallimortis]